VGAAGEKVVRVVVDKEGRVITAFPVKSIIERVAIRGYRCPRSWRSSRSS
jgi:hypothetical protein